MFEGHDTTANGLLWTLYCIANNPDVEQRVFEEVDQILGNSSFPSDYEHLKKFTYLSCVIKEVLFLFIFILFIFIFLLFFFFLFIYFYLFIFILFYLFNNLIIKIKKAQRLYPPVPYIGRTLTETIEINGLSFPPNVPF